MRLDKIQDVPQKVEGSVFLSTEGHRLTMTPDEFRQIYVQMKSLRRKFRFTLGPSQKDRT